MRLELYISDHLSPGRDHRCRRHGSVLSDHAGSPREYGYLISPYLKAFKKNFIPGSKIFLILLPVGFAFSGSGYYWFRSPVPGAKLLTLIQLLLLLLWRVIWCYNFSLTARFENSALQTLRNAVGLSLLNLKISLCLLVEDAAVLTVVLVFPHSELLLLVFGFAALSWLRSGMLIHIFSRYEETEHEARGLTETGNGNMYLVFRTVYEITVSISGIL